MHVSCLPIALCTSAAATDESTPPDSAQMARSPPTWARIFATCSSMTDAIFHVGEHPARSWRNVRSTAMPCGEWTTSGWNCTPQIRRLSFSSTATGASGVLAVARKPGGASVTASKWLIHTSCDSGTSMCSTDDVAVRVRWARPYSPRMPRPTVPPSCCAISCAP